MKASTAVLKALAVVVELTQTEISPAAAAVMASDLARYPEDQVLTALSRCRRECRPRQFSIEAVISRLPDGRPNPEEAWAMIPRDETASSSWTEEMRAAWAVCLPLIREGERIPARMAFIENYRTAVQIARDQGVLPKWTMTLGTDPQGRELAVLEAVEKKRISVEAGVALLPNSSFSSAAVQVQDLLGQHDTKLLTSTVAKNAEAKDPPKQRRMMDLIDQFKFKKIPEADDGTQTA